MAEDKLSEIYAARMGANVGAAAVAYLASQYEELKTPNSEMCNKLADFLQNQPADLREKICVLPIKMASIAEQMKNPTNIAENDADIMQKHQYMYADINQVIDRTMPSFVKWTQTLDETQKVEQTGAYSDYVETPEYSVTSNESIVYMSQMVRNEHIEFSKDCDAVQAVATVKELAQNARAYKVVQMEDGQADERTSFGDTMQFMEKHALQASQAMQVLGKTVPNYANLPAAERAKYVAMAEKFPQEVKVAAYVAQARGQAVSSSELFNQQIRQPDIVIASRMLEENVVTPTGESVEKAMFAQKALDVMKTDIGVDIDLMSSQGQEYMKTAQKFGEAALIAVCMAASKGETIASPKDLMTKSLNSFKLMQYMHDEKYPSRCLNMNNLHNAIRHVQSQQKTYNARLMVQNLGYNIG